MYTKNTNMTNLYNSLEINELILIYGLFHKKYIFTQLKYCLIGG